MKFPLIIKGLLLFYSGSALQQGANAIEVDLSVSADGQVFLWHDPSPLSLHAIARRLVTIQHFLQTAFAQEHYI